MMERKKRRREKKKEMKEIKEEEPPPLPSFKRNGRSEKNTRLSCNR